MEEIRQTGHLCPWKPHYSYHVPDRISLSSQAFETLMCSVWEAETPSTSVLPPRIVSVPYKLFALITLHIEGTYVYTDNIENSCLHNHRNLELDPQNIITGTPLGINLFSFPLIIIHKKTETQKKEVSCSRSHSKLVPVLDQNPDILCSSSELCSSAPVTHSSFS